MGRTDNWTVFPGKRCEEWQVADRGGQDIEAVGQIRDEIGGRVGELVSRLLPG